MNFPDAIYADDDLVCGESPEPECRVKYIRADIAEAAMQDKARLDMAAKLHLSMEIVENVAGNIERTMVALDRFNLDLLAVLGVEPVVADLVAADLIDQVRFTREPEYVFRHPLVRAVAYESLLKSDRAELHRPS